VFAFLRKRLQGFFERHPSLELAGALLFIVLGLGVLLLNPEGEGRYGIPMYVIGPALILLMLVPATRAIRRIRASGKDDSLQ
jgi:hypothetical protein